MQTQGPDSLMLHSAMLARAGVGFQAAWDRATQHDVQLLIITRLRGTSLYVFLGPEHTKSNIAQSVRRQALK